MNYKEFKEKQKVEYKEFKEKLDIKLNEFKEKLKLKLDKFKEKEKIKKNKSKNTKRKVKGGVIDIDIATSIICKLYYVFYELELNGYELTQNEIILFKINTMLNQDEIDLLQSIVGDDNETFDYIIEGIFKSIQKNNSELFKINYLDNIKNFIKFLNKSKLVANSGYINFDIIILLKKLDLLSKQQQINLRSIILNDDEIKDLKLIFDKYITEITDDNLIILYNYINELFNIYITYGDINLDYIDSILKIKIEKYITELSNVLSIIFEKENYDNYGGNLLEAMIRKINNEKKIPVIPIKNYINTVLRPKINSLSIRPLDRPLDRPSNRLSDRLLARQLDRPSYRPLERPLERPLNRPSNRLLERPLESPSDRISDRVLRSSTDLLLQRPPARSPAIPPESQYDTSRLTAEQQKLIISGVSSRLQPRNPFNLRELLEKSALSSKPPTWTTGEK